MRAGLRPNAGGEVAAHKIARNRRNFRINTCPNLADPDLDREADHYAMWIRMIRAGHPSVIRLSEVQARIRALHHEASKRGLTLSWHRTTGMKGRA